MKKIMPLLALFLLLAGCTGSCGVAATTPTPSPETTTPQPTETATQIPAETPDETVEPEETGAVRPVPMPTPSPETTASPSPPPIVTPPPSTLPERPDDAEVLEAYQQAEVTFSWFQMETLPVDPSDTIKENELVYARVEYPGISSMADLRGALKRLFSDDLVDYLLPLGGTQYKDFNGVLYVQEGARGGDITKGGEQRQILWESDTKCKVQVVVEVLDPDQNFAIVGSETYAFPYEKVGSGWIFTDFYLIR